MYLLNASAILFVDLLSIIFLRTPVLDCGPKKLQHKLSHCNLMVSIDHADAGFFIASETMDTLTGRQAMQFERMSADHQQVRAGAYEL